MKHLTKAVNRLAKAIEIQNKQLAIYQAKNNSSTDILPYMLLMSMFNSNNTMKDAIEQFQQHNKAAK